MFTAENPRSGERSYIRGAVWAAAAGGILEKCNHARQSLGVPMFTAENPRSGERGYVRGGVGASAAGSILEKC